jgi:hypothetical protein
MGAGGTPRAHRVEVSEDPAVLTGAGYSSAFATTPVDGDRRTAEQWGRAMFEGAPLVVRWAVQLGWRFVMGFRLGPRFSPGHVLGWTVESTAPDALVLGVSSPRATARKVVRVEPAGVTATTFVRFDRPSGRVVWAAITPVHHVMEPYFLRHAAAHP